MLRHSNDSEPGYTPPEEGPLLGLFRRDGKRITDRDEIDRLNAIALPPAYTDAWFCKDRQRPYPGDRQGCARAASNIATTPIIAPSRTRPNMTAAANSARRCPSSARRVETRPEAAQARPRHRARRGRPAARHASICASATSNMPRTTRASARRRCASRHLKRKRRQAEDALRRQARHRPRSDDHRRQPQARSSASARTCPARCCSNMSTATASRRPITSADVNDYIREAIGRRFHRQAFPHLGRERHRLRAIADEGRETRISLKTMIEPVAEALGNTVAMSRKTYVHPALIDAVKDDPRDPLDGMKRPRARTSPVERRDRLPRLPQEASRAARGARPRLDPRAVQPPQARHDEPLEPRSASAELRASSLG